jgi:ABC-type multidrug transport system ATPase subunit
MPRPLAPFRATGPCSTSTSCVWELAEELRDRGCAIVVISHLVFEEHRFDAVLELAHGKIAREHGVRESTGV